MGRLGRHGDGGARRERGTALGRAANSGRGTRDRTGPNDDDGQCWRRGGDGGRGPTKSDREPAVTATSAALIRSRLKAASRVIDVPRRAILNI